MPDADFISLEWVEDGLHLRLYIDDEWNEDTTDLRISDPVEFYRAVRQSCDTWIQEMEAARREYVTGRADDPTQQPVLDRIRGHGGSLEVYDPEGEDQRHAADLARKAAKENQ